MSLHPLPTQAPATVLATADFQEATAAAIVERARSRGILLEHGEALDLVALWAERRRPFSGESPAAYGARLFR